MSSLMCPKCNGGLKWIDNPNDPGARMQCENCKKTWTMKSYMKQLRDSWIKKLYYRVRWPFVVAKIRIKYIYLPWIRGDKK